jgi:hypothetical protein
MYDFIGDIHGHATQLKELLQKLGYQKNGDSYSHPDRKVFFVGDYIDRGPQCRETLHIVRSMVESGNARALMGNHEFNALCYHYPDGVGGYLRAHNPQNHTQHEKTLLAFRDHASEWEDYLQWFLTLPLYWEEESFRAVHAAWHRDSIRFLDSKLEDCRLTKDLVYDAAKEETDMFVAVEHVLKGVEEYLGGPTIRDKENRERSHVRIKWWHEDHEATLRTKAIKHGLEHIDLPDYALKFTDWYTADQKPVFFGHYWYKGDPHPYLLSSNVCCLDFSVAHFGHLTAYRFDGEQRLDQSKIVFV